MEESERRRDLFSELPAEIMHTIFSNLNSLYAGLPNATGLHYLETHRVSRRYRHPFLNLAQCSKRAYEAVEGHCRSMLIQHKAITKFKPFNEKSKAKHKLLMSYRGHWHRFCRRKCAFCGKTTNRAAIFNCLIKCCSACDKKEWPVKITRSQALLDYKLNLQDLINTSDAHITDFSPSSTSVWPGALMRPLEAWPSTGLKSQRHALYLGPGLETTMFFKHEVEERAKVMRGDCLVEGLVDLSRRKGVSDPGLKGAIVKKRKKTVSNTAQDPFVIPDD